MSEKIEDRKNLILDLRSAEILQQLLQIKKISRKAW